MRPLLLRILSLAGHQTRRTSTTPNYYSLSRGKGCSASIMNQMKVVAVILSGVSLILAIVSLAIPYWMKISISIGIYSTTTNAGLWSVCSSSVCAAMPNAPDTLKAVRAMMILGMLALVGSTVFGALNTFLMEKQKLLKLLAAVAAFSAGGMCLIGAVIYAADVLSAFGAAASNLHAGFALAIIAACSAFGTGGCFIKAPDS